MSDFELVELGAAKVDEKTNLAVVEATIPLTGDPDDVEHFGSIDVFGALGVTSLPAPANDEGSAEGIVARNVVGKDGVLIAARDERTSSLTGNMQPGDTILHSTGPNQAAQVQCKEEKRQVVLATIDESDKSVMIVVDGKNQKIQIAGFGHIFEMSADGGISMVEKGGAGIVCKDGVTQILGTLTIGKGALVPVVTGTPGPGQFPGVGLFVGQ